MEKPQARPWPHVIRGMPLPWRVLDSNLQGVMDMEVRDSDVVVVSYPKSGTNWLRNIVNCILECPEDQNNMSMPLETSLASSTDVENLEAASPVYKIVQSWTSPRVMFTHLYPHLLPSQLFEKKAKVVYICRNPKDVAVSFYHFCQMIQGKEPCPSQEEFIQQFLQGQVPFGSYFTNVKRYWEMRERRNFLLVKYEDMKKNDRAVIEQVATFLGRELSPQKIRNISSQCSLQSMRTKFTRTQQAMSVILDETKGHFIRKGNVGSWQETLTVNQSERIDQMFNEHLGSSGLTFEYE